MKINFFAFPALAVAFTALSALSYAYLPGESGFVSLEPGGAFCLGFQGGSCLVLFR